VLGLANLARRGPGRQIMIEEVSREENIPRSFLAKIFQNLAKAGFVESHRGAGGGFVLSKRPEEISVLEVLEAVEGRIALQRCVEDASACSQTEGCILCGFLVQAQEQVRDVFARTSLADLLKSERRFPGDGKTAATILGAS